MTWRLSLSVLSADWRLYSALLVLAAQLSAGPFQVRLRLGPWNSYAPSKLTLHRVTLNMWRARGRCLSTQSSTFTRIKSSGRFLHAMYTQSSPIQGASPAALARSNSFKFRLGRKLSA